MPQLNHTQGPSSPQALPPFAGIDRIAKNRELRGYRDQDAQEWDVLIEFLFQQDFPAATLERITWRGTHTRELARALVEIEQRGQDPRDPDAIAKALQVHSVSKSFYVRREAWSACIAADVHDDQDVLAFFSDWARRDQDMARYERHAKHLKQSRSTEFEVRILTVILGPPADARFVPSDFPSQEVGR